MWYHSQIFYTFYRDNPETDIYGANLYNRYLKKRSLQQRNKRTKQKLSTASGTSSDIDSDDEELSSSVNMMEDEDLDSNNAQSCQSILVCTGVYCSSRDYVRYDAKRPSNHNHRDFVLDPELKRPTYVVQNVLEAVKLVFEKERMQWWRKSEIDRNVILFLKKSCYVFFFIYFLFIQFLCTVYDSKKWTSICFIMFS